jgi:Cu(I)/Ag(I) efflux system protein CusF
MQLDSCELGECSVKRLLLLAAMVNLTANYAVAATPPTPPLTLQASNMQPSGELLDVQGVGVVKAIDTAKDTITLRHEPIASVGWPAMTMTLKVASPDLLQVAKIGDKVQFTLHEPDMANVITAIKAAQR